MAIWIRNSSGSLPTATNSDLNGTIELDNGTAPIGFDPANVNSVRIQHRIHIGSGTFSGSENHTVLRTGDLTLNGNGSTIATINGSNATLDNGSGPIDTDETDSSPNQSFSVAQWETAELNATYTTFNQDMGPDGVLISFATPNFIVVTIDYEGGDSAAWQPPYFPYKRIATRM